MNSKTSWDPKKALEKCPGVTDIFKKLDAKFTGQQKEKMDETIKKLDEGFIREKCEVTKDTILEIQRNKKTTPNILLQRNIWSSLDAIALHFDYIGFTSVFQEIAPTYFEEDIHLDDPEIICFEWQMMLDFLGIDEKEAEELDLSLSEVSEVMKLAEKEKYGPHGLSYITSPEFSFKKALAENCARPDKILERHSPDAKSIITIIAAIVDIITLFAGFAFWPAWILTVVTIIVMVIVGDAGC